MNTKKAHDLSKGKLRFTLNNRFTFGLIITMIAVLTAFNWRTPLRFNDDFNPVTSGSDITDDYIPVIIVPKKELPKPKPIVKKITTAPPIAVKNIVVTTPPEYTEPLPMPDVQLPDEKIPDEKNIWTFIENYPVFKGCPTYVSEDEKKACTDYEILKYLKDNFIMPIEAIEKGIAGKMHLTFVIETDGSVNIVNILQGIDNGAILEKEAIRVIKTFPKFIPGEQQGRKVRVSYNVPFNININ